MKQNLNTRELNLSMICLPICGLLFLYIILRAFNLSFTHDESLSYNLITDKDYLAYTANNHLLNTWLMALCAWLFGEHEFSLRLPNVLLFAVYLFFCCKLIKESGKTIFIFFALPLLFLNPFVLDFFSLARGYGLSLGFVMASLYYFLRGNSKDYTYSSFSKNFIFSMIFGTLALLSNLSLINFYIALLIVFAGQYILFCRNTMKTGLKKNLQLILLFIIACIPLFLVLKRLMILKNANDLYVGADSIDETVSSFIERSGYFVPYPVWFTEVLQTFIIYIFPVGLIITLLRKNYDSPLLKLGILMTLILIGFYTEHYLFSTLFPISRTGVYFIPLFCFFIFYLFKQFIESQKPKLQKTFMIAGFVFISLPLTIHFFKTINLIHFFEWKYEAHTKEVVLTIENKNKKNVLGYNWIFGPAINYYIHSGKLNITPVKLEQSSSYDQADYIYEFQDQLKDEKWKAVKLYDDIGSGLYKNPK